jgi:hypothetical protein
MKKTFLVLIALTLAFGLVWFGCDKEPSRVSGPDIENQQLMKAAQLPVAFERVMNIQKKHTSKLLEIPDVIGTATGLGPDNTPAVLVLTKAPGVEGIPDSLDGVPVVVKVTGEIVSFAKPGNLGSPSKVTVNPRARFARPVPIGVSTGVLPLAGNCPCSTGTIGCRLTDGTNVYALGNNHFYALENMSSRGDKILQPGLFDTGCSFDENNVIGTLYDFAEIVYDNVTENTIDAAIAICPPGNLGNATPSNGYGTPKKTTVQAYIGQKVQKYGKGSSLTKGTVTGINVTVHVTCCAGTALFTGQIIVEANKPFIDFGDSGSLLVTDPNREPVGLIFAGDRNGKLAMANQINLVLARFGVSIDGE